MTQAPRPLRRDARENRERLLAAAHAVIAEDGREAALEEIARRAGVGIGTLYRHFPDRGALLDALAEEHVARIGALAAEALGSDDPWDALAGFLEQVVALQERDLTLRDALLERPVAGRLDHVRAPLRASIEELLARARAQGMLRPDVVYADVVVALWSLGRVVEVTAGPAPAAWRRYLALVLDGLRASPASAALTPPLTDEQLAAAHRALRERHGRRRAERAA